MVGCAATVALLSSSVGAKVVGSTAGASASPSEIRVARVHRRLDSQLHSGFFLGTSCQRRPRQSSRWGPCPSTGEDGVTFSPFGPPHRPSVR
jgi:hypothetical protein